MVILYIYNENNEEVTSRYKYENGKLLTKDGKEYDGSDKADPIFQLVKGQLNSIKSLTKGNKEIAKLFSDLESTEWDHDIIIGMEPNNPKGKNKDEKHVNYNTTNILFGSVTHFNALETHDPDANEPEINPMIGLLHELKHAHDAEMGIPNQTSGGISNKTGRYQDVKSWEFRAVDTENILRRAMGVDRRTSYGGVPVPDSYLFN